jgi:hypothetical protein
MIMQNSSVTCAAIALVLVCLVGCIGDPIKPTQQRLTLVVVEANGTRTAVRGAQVTALFRGSFESSCNLSPEVMSLVDRAADFPDNNGTTDANGTVAIDARTTSRREHVQMRTSLDDQVTDMCWAFRVVHDSARDYLLIPKMREGAQVRGNSFELQVRQIGQPQARSNEQQ